MADLPASELIKIPPGPERDKHYDYPYTGPYCGEPQLDEMLYQMEREEVWDKSSLGISRSCPNCSGKHTHNTTRGWIICFSCLIAFTLEDSQGYYDVAGYEMDEREEET